jgi:phospholipid/cholesterol/gamma-HCH transport system substrate-binding protein
MSTIFDVRNLHLSKVPRRAILVGALVAVLGLVLVPVGVLGGRELYRKLTTNSAVA